jgi:hypothetical protein
MMEVIFRLSSDVGKSQKELEELILYQVAAEFVNNGFNIEDMDINEDIDVVEILAKVEIDV